MTRDQLTKNFQGVLVSPDRGEYWLKHGGSPVASYPSPHAAIIHTLTKAERQGMDNVLREVHNYLGALKRIEQQTRMAQKPDPTAAAVSDIRLALLTELIHDIPTQVKDKQ